ncbi:MAG: HEAT repeat domain-containing protein [SAR202 cluster bacterium]|nr:HEAT repeat domain-containing protein [SAR202 cluster bacterium]
MSLETYLEELTQEDIPLKYGEFLELSSLDSDDMELIQEVWPQLSPERRLDLVSRLVETSEENIDMDFTPIFKLALKDEAEFVRCKAVSGLWECEDRPLITTFIKLLEGDPSTEVRTAAAQALGKFAVLAEDGKLLSLDNGRIQGVLLPLVKSEDLPLILRRRALESVGVFSSDEITQTIDWAYKHDDTEMQQSAIFAMGRNADFLWTEVIRAALDREEPAIRYEAALACGELGEEEMVPDLLPLLKDEDLQVRLSSINALGSIGGSLAKKALTACLKSDDDVVSQTAEEALESMESNDDPLNFKYHS